MYTHAAFSFIVNLSKFAPTLEQLRRRYTVDRNDPNVRRFSLEVPLACAELEQISKLMNGMDRAAESARFDCVAEFRALRAAVRGLDEGRRRMVPTNDEAHRVQGGRTAQRRMTRREGNCSA